MAVTPTTAAEDKQRNVIRFLTRENASDSEIHMRICVVYGVQNVITNKL